MWGSNANAMPGIDNCLSVTSATGWKLIVSSCASCPFTLRWSYAIHVPSVWGSSEEFAVIMGALQVPPERTYFMTLQLEPEHSSQTTRFPEGATSGASGTAVPDTLN